MDCITRRDTLSALYFHNFLSSLAISRFRDNQSKAVETFDVIGLAGELDDGAVLSGGNDTRIDCIVIRVEQSTLLIYSGNLPPQGFGALAATVADVEGDDLTCKSQYLI